MRAVKERNEIPALSRMVYLDNAGAGLPPFSVTNAMKRFLGEWSKSGERWEEWLKDIIETRRLFGKLVGARGDEVAVVPSVSSALAAVASSVDLRKRKKVVTSSLNFPTNVILWQRMREAGLLKEVDVLRSRGGSIPLSAYERAIDDDTAAVSVDYVSWLSGARENVKDVAEIAHSHGAKMIVDSFHGLGVFPFDVKRDGIDILVNGFYKWLCGPHGVACAYVDEDIVRELEPSYLGWMGIHENVIERLQSGRDPFDVPFPLDSARPASTSARYEWGTWAAVCVPGAIEAMRFAIETGIASRYKRIRTMKERLREGLEEMGLKMLTPPPERNPGAGIATFLAKNQRDLVSGLARRKVVVSGRFGHVRVSPHFYNTEEEVEELLSAVKSVANV